MIFILRQNVLQVVVKSSKIFKRKSSGLKAVLEEKIECERKKLIAFKKEHGKTIMGEVTINQMYGGMRGLKAMVCETSVLDPEQGIRFRGLTIPDIRKSLPKAPDGKEPLPEGILWLLMTGECPTEEQVCRLSRELAERAYLPKHVKKMLKKLPCHVHPMTQLSAAVTLLNTESIFAEKASTMKKIDLWKCMYEDCMNLIAAMPLIGASIYNNLYRDHAPIGHIDESKDWSYNYATMMGFCDPEFVELMRLYLTIHCDHEGGNVSAHTVHLVGSALSDAYLSLGAGLSGLAGPLHGLANQQVLVWIKAMQKQLGDQPSEEKIKEFVNKTLKSGQVIPGYGHAVLRKTDPRYIVQREFAQEHCPNDPMYKLVSDLYKVVPPILESLGKVQNPWPNVDAHSGVLLQHYGMEEMNYYTVLFGVSRALGVLSQLVWSRALLLPIERPKSMSSEGLIKHVASINKGKDDKKKK